MAEPKQLTLPFSIPVNASEVDDLGCARVKEQADRGGDNPLVGMKIAFDAHMNLQSLAGLKIGEAEFNALNKAIETVKDCMVAELSKIPLPEGEPTEGDGLYAPYMFKVAAALLAMFGGALLEEYTVTERYLYLAELIRSWAFTGVVGASQKAGLTNQQIADSNAMRGLLTPVPMPVLLKLARQKQEAEAEAARRGISVEDLAREKLAGMFKEADKARSDQLARAPIKGDDEMAF